MSKQSQHTPGPWRVANDQRICSPGPWIEAYDSKGRLFDIAQCNFGETLVTDPDLAEACANAELIASAPDLLAECERLRAENRELTSQLASARGTIDMTTDECRMRGGELSAVLAQNAELVGALRQITETIGQHSMSCRSRRSDKPANLACNCELPTVHGLARAALARAEKGE